MAGLACPLHYSVKTVVFISSVIYCADGSICFHNTVGTLDYVAVSRLPLALDVAGVRVVNTIIEFVPRVMSLGQQQCKE
jgi:hypothetical protein